MPNGNDRNWIRLCLTIDGFRSRFGSWPSIVRAMPEIVNDIREHLLNHEQRVILYSKITLLSEGESLIAADNAGNSFAYGDETARDQHSDLSAMEWLGIAPHAEDESQNYIFTPASKQGDNKPGEIVPRHGSRAVQFTPIIYASLNARQKEIHNFQKLSAALADFGFTTIKLSDDWQGADFIALHIDAKTVLRVQLKGRVVVNKKYEDKNLYVSFFHKPYWYLYPHDEFLEILRVRKPKLFETESWRLRGGYSFGRLDPVLTDMLRPYRIPKVITESDEPIEDDSDE